MSDIGMEIDIDRGSIYLDGEWLTSADLTERMRAKIAAGDFKVSSLSLALEQLETLMGRLEMMSVKLTPEVLDTYARIAAHEQIPVAQLYRRALLHYLTTEEAATRLYESRRGG